MSDRSAVALTSKYDRGALLGEGTWGLVFQASRLEDGTQVAIKRIKPAPRIEEGISFSALREIKYLKQLKHENIIEVL
jgi:cyclin-dependent kinase 7